MRSGSIHLSTEMARRTCGSSRCRADVSFDSKAGRGRGFGRLAAPRHQPTGTLADGRAGGTGDRTAGSTGGMPTACTKPAATAHRRSSRRPTISYGRPPRPPRIQSAEWPAPGIVESRFWIITSPGRGPGRSPADRRRAGRAPAVGNSGGYPRLPMAASCDGRQHDSSYPTPRKGGQTTVHGSGATSDGIVKSTRSCQWLATRASRSPSRRTLSPREASLVGSLARPHHMRSFDHPTGWPQESGLL